MWGDDKKQVLTKLVDLYQEIDYSPNRYEACKGIFREFEFFFDHLIGSDPTLKSLINIDKEFVETYLDTMSELMGEEL